MQPAPSPESAGPSFQEAFTALLALAPGPVFPRARQLYLRKYPLEGALQRASQGASEPGSSSGASDSDGRFRTFLLDEEIQEGSAGIYRVRGRRFAVVHWQAPQTNPDDYRTYLRRRWQLEPAELTLQPESWFRSGGAFAAFQATAVYERQGSSELRVSVSGPEAPPLP